MHSTSFPGRSLPIRRRLSGATGLIVLTLSLAAFGPAADISPNEIYGPQPMRDHSGLIPANLITLAHFSVSLAISFPNSAGESGRTVAPNAVRRVFIVGSTRLALISVFSLPITSAGVRAGAPNPRKPLAS